jgi:hypothetical protein
MFHSKAGYVLAFASAAAVAAMLVYQFLNVSGLLYPHGG